MAKAQSTQVGSSRLHHPLYDTWAPTWAKALDVYEGSGGFLEEDRPYLKPHPREWLDHSLPETNDAGDVVRWVPNPIPMKPSPKLRTRRALARYENIAATLIESLMGALFLDAPARTFTEEAGNPQITTWVADVDGRGTHADQFWSDAWVSAAVFGHAVILTDKDRSGDADAPQTQADVTGPTLRAYTPLDLIDWLTDDDGHLMAVKLLEAAPRLTFDVKPLALKDTRVRVVDRETWALYDASGRKIEGAAHGFGRLPVTILYGRRRPLTPIVGKSIMGDPQLYIDAYNLISEVRELLRNQTFALLNVPIGVDGDVQREQERIGRQGGTQSVLFSTNPASYISPQPDNVAAYHEHLDRLQRMIYRLAAMPWEGDSRDAESADSRRLKRQDLHNVLGKYAAEVQRAERDVLDLVYRAFYGPDRGPEQRERDGATVTYPTRFEVPDMAAVAAQAGELIGLDLGETATKEIKKRTVRVALPNLSAEAQQASDAEINGQTVLTADEKQAQLLAQTQARFGPPPAA